MKTLLKIEGMSCQNCVRHATEALQNVEGVVSAEVTLEPGQAVVEHSEQTTLQQLLDALEEEGYTGSARE